MLAKAIATESGANFISISMSSIASKWFGEGEKYTRAVFTLASKISPCVIFVDEIDSLLGKRESNGEHEAMRKIKNEFMMMWDGLKSKDNERVIVLGATNRPFDLDEAVLRRMPRRILVDLPDSENRKKILKVILQDEELTPNVNIDEISNLTEGFSGSDLKNLCIAAAYQSIRDYLKKEKNKKRKSCEEVYETNKKIKLESGEVLLPNNDMMEVSKDENENNQNENNQNENNQIENNHNENNRKENDQTSLRPLESSDFTKALSEISASVSENAFAISELRRWNEMYGEGGKRRKSTLSYFG